MDCSVNHQDAGVVDGNVKLQGFGLMDGSVKHQGSGLIDGGVNLQAPVSPAWLESKFCLNYQHMIKSQPIS